MTDNNEQTNKINLMKKKSENDKSVCLFENKKMLSFGLLGVGAICVYLIVKNMELKLKIKKEALKDKHCEAANVDVAVISKSYMQQNQRELFKLVNDLGYIILSKDDFEVLKNNTYLLTELTQKKPNDKIQNQTGDKDQNKNDEIKEKIEDQDTEQKIENEQKKKEKELTELRQKQIDEQEEEQEKLKQEYIFNISNEDLGITFDESEQIADMSITGDDNTEDDVQNEFDEIYNKIKLNGKKKSGFDDIENKNNFVTYTNFYTDNEIEEREEQFEKQETTLDNALQQENLIDTNQDTITVVDTISSSHLKKKVLNNIVQ